MIPEAGFSSKFLIHTETTQIIMNDRKSVQAVNIYREMGWIKIIVNKNNMVRQRVQHPTRDMDDCVLPDTGLCDKLITCAEETVVRRCV
jgi:hypothetical protein